MTPLHSDVKHDVFIVFVRYMINAARQKRLVPYYELENIFGLSHRIAGYYAGGLGHFCEQHRLPVLNSLIVNAGSARPGEGFDEWQYEAGRDVDEAEEMLKCFKRFHATSSSEYKTEHFAEINQVIREWMTPS